jgi:hypothetical protein
LTPSQKEEIFLSFFPKKAFLPKELLKKSYGLFKSSFAKKAFFGKKLKFFLFFGVGQGGIYSHI